MSWLSYIYWLIHFNLDHTNAQMRPQESAAHPQNTLLQANNYWVLLLYVKMF